MVILMNRCILLCPPIIMYHEVCCCLHIHSVVNVLVMGLVLGQSLMVISTTGILLYAKVSPLYNVIRVSLMVISETDIMLYAKVSPLYNVLWKCIVVVYT